MFNTKEVVKTQSNNIPGKFLNVGIHKVKIHNIEAFKASTGNYQYRFGVETEPITTPGFTPYEGHNGAIGTVKAEYLTPPRTFQGKNGEVTYDPVKIFTELVADLADELGVRTEVDNIESNSHEEYAEKLLNIVKDKYIYLTINGREYINQTSGKTGLELNFPRYKAWANLEKFDEKGESCLSKPNLRKLPNLPAQEGEQPAPADLY